MHLRNLADFSLTVNIITLSLCYTFLAFLCLWGSNVIATRHLKSQRGEKRAPLEEAQKIPLTADITPGIWLNF